MPRRALGLSEEEACSVSSCDSVLRDLVGVLASSGGQAEHAEVDPSRPNPHLTMHILQASQSGLEKSPQAALEGILPIANGQRFALGEGLPPLQGCQHLVFGLV
jgi:hypothetical protein